jgi:hypothetical protein
VRLEGLIYIYIGGSVGYYAPSTREQVARKWLRARALSVQQRRGGVGWCIKMRVLRARARVCKWTSRRADIGEHQRRSVDWLAPPAFWRWRQGRTRLATQELLLASESEVPGW